MTTQFIDRIIGMAGHVDHGKSSLVENLTGLAPQRHPEERARGMTLDLSVRPFVIEGHGTVGMVDVPGHADFVKNMVAGVSAIDVAVVVVAADDGVMPQTREHLRILSLLGVETVIVALTKIDLVTPDLTDLVEVEVMDECAKLSITPLGLHRISNTTKEGFDEFRAALVQAVLQLPQRTADPRAFRSYVRHVFQRSGFGTVVTGIPISGQLLIGGDVEILPSGKLSAARSIQSYGTAVPQAAAGISSAIVMKDVAGVEISRGEAICALGVYRSVDRFVGSIRFFDARTLPGSKTQVILHTATARVPCRLRRIRGRDGSEFDAILTVHLDASTVIAPGDRFILRGGSPETTLGGGMMMVPLTELSARRLVRSGADLHALARHVASGDLIGAAFITQQPVTTFYELTPLALMERAALRSEIERRTQNGDLVKVSDDHFLIRSRVDALKDAAVLLCQRYHNDRPLAWGMDPSLLCKRLGIPIEGFSVVWPHIAGDRLQTKNGRVALLTWSPALSSALLELRSKILSLVKASGKASIARGDLISQSGASSKDFNLLTQILCDEGEIMALGQARFIPIEVRHEALIALTRLAETDPIVTLTRFRAETQYSRNVAVDLLECLDQEGITRREGDGRVVVQASVP